MIRLGNKKKHLDIRMAEIMLQKLLAICAVTGKTKTAMIEDLILREYDRDSRYGKQYIANLNREK